MKYICQVQIQSNLGHGRRLTKNFLDEKVIKSFYIFQEIEWWLNVEKKSIKKLPREQSAAKIGCDQRFLIVDFEENAYLIQYIFLFLYLFIN